MKILLLLIFMARLAEALHSKYISSNLFTRIAVIVFTYAGALFLNAFYIQSIGSGIGIYSGLFHVTSVSQLLDTFIFFIGSLIYLLYMNFKLVTDVESGNYDKNILLYSLQKQTPTQSRDTATDTQKQDRHSCTDINLSLVKNTSYLKRFKNIVINCSLFLKNNVYNVISIFVLCIILVIFCLDISFSDSPILKSLIYVCAVIISFTFSMIISKIYNWSDNFFIRTIQKSIFYIILLLISYLLLIYFGIDINSLFNTIYCDSDDEDSDDEDNGNDNDNGVVANSGDEISDKGKGKEVLTVENTFDNKLVS